MSYAIQLRIKKTAEKDFKMYIYRSTNSENINTLAKLRAMQPAFILDEQTYAGDMDEDYYIVNDIPQETVGVTYFGPEPTHVPATEYETDLTMEQKDGIYFPVLELKPLKASYVGVLYYYSIVGVRQDQITHLSKMNAAVLKSDFQNSGSREIQSCDNYTGSLTDHWITLTSNNWNEDIIIGDITKPISQLRYGNPFVSKVPMFTEEEVIVDTHVCNTYDETYLNPNYIRLKIPNIWRIGNKDYNTRKLKSFRVRNIYEGKYSDFSEPTFQTTLPFAIESLLIYRKDITDDLTAAANPLPANNENLLLTIIRKNGVYYNSSLHKDLELNPYVIDTKNNSIAVYGESSVQEYILVDCHGKFQNTYQYTIYLKDGYGTLSEPVNFIVTI